MNRSRGGAACATLLLGTLLSSFPLRAQESRVQELNTQVAQLVRQGRFADAVPVATEALKVAEATYGINSAKVASALSTLGLTYYYQAKYTQAEPIFQRAVQIAEKAVGPESPDLASDLGNLALNDAQLGKSADAVSLLQRAVSITRRDNLREGTWPRRCIRGPSKSRRRLLRFIRTTPPPASTISRTSI